MDVQQFALSVTDTYRQTFNCDFCQDGTAFNSQGMQKKEFISPEKLIRSLSCSHAVLSVLEFLEINSQFYSSQQASLFLFIYKQILFRTERRRKRCESFKKLAEIGTQHFADLQALQQAIKAYKRNAFSLPFALDCVSLIMWFFQQEKSFDFKKALSTTLELQNY